MESSGFLYRLFNITKPWSFAWIAVGFLGQALFTFRMVLQWYASEKEKRSVIPVAFWWGSLFGGILLFVYFVWRKDIVGIVGQSTGIFVYARNLVLIHRRPLPARPPAVPAN
ncbi:MAG: lipid-A-disaccharide synthase N-terminal domain-containing protein [Planctomycetota bacterium]|nr:lipid-A-disaccharide synthase N-terminal domain-containing protein [Planctomycetota bacterium]